MSNNVNSEILTLVNLLSTEKNISREIIFNAIEDAFAKIAAGYYSTRGELIAKINPHHGEVGFFQKKIISDQEEDPEIYITFKEAKKIDPEIQQENEFVLIQLPQISMQRVFAGSVRNIILEKILSAEKENEYNEFKDREGEIIIGIVKKVSSINLIVNIRGKAEGVIFRDGLLKTDSYRIGDRIKCYIKAIERSDTNCQIILSRTCNEFLATLLAEAVVEIQEGTIEIKSVARDCNSKAKIAVYSSDPRLDPVGACIGPKGSRIRPIIDELKGEKIDIIYWERDLVQFARNAISPAKSLSGSFSEELNTVEMVVEEEQLKLAIGRGGQNVRLASQLIGCNITIISEQMKKEESTKKFNSTVASLAEALELEETVAQFLVSSGISSPNDIIATGIEKLMKTGVFNQEIAEELVKRSTEYIENQQKEYQIEIEKLEISNEVINLVGDTNLAIKLAQNGNVKTIEDLADLSLDEFVEYTTIQDYQQKEASRAIMQARKEVYGI